MHANPDTEALLTLRDGEPIDAALHAQLIAQPGSAEELARLQQMKTALGALPELAPPDDGWERISAALDRRAAWRFAAPLRLAGGAAIAATVALAAMLYIARAPQTSDLPAATASAGGFDQAAFARPVLPASYVALVEESARLERLLAQIPYQRPMMTAGTASTIVGLEDRIAFVDAQLTLAAAGGTQLPQRQALWGERVELMNALVYVRFAQAQPTGF